jgi:malonyl-CoA/methylmalonyl-CoA synthetase
MLTLLARLAAHADAPAVLTTEGLHRYRNLDVASRRVAAALLEGRDDLREARVAMLVPPSFEFIALLCGIWRAGGVAVPLAVSHPPAELDYVIRDADASLVASTTAFAHVAAPLGADAGARYVTTAELLAAGGRGAAGPLELPGERRALILHTSGTTGKPKGVVLTHANLEAQIETLVTAWEWTGEDRTLLVLPLHHVHGIVNVVGSALWAGAVCEVLPRFDADAAWARLSSGDITVFTAVPTIYHRLIASWEAAPPEEQRARSAGARQARVMMSGSAALPVSTLERWREITGHTLLERYGMTEIGMALSNPLHGERRPGRVGGPLPGVSVRLVDEAGEPVPDGTTGEIEVRGPSVFQEYWRRPDETRQAFRDGWFRTGDTAVVDAGVYRILGRTSIDIIKTGGHKVSALEIEDVLRDHPAVAECAVVAAADPEWGERVCVAVELRPGGTLALAELQAWLTPRLAGHKIPRDIRCVPALPRNTMGKVVKRDVADWFKGDPGQG